jgi:hypothetical protein
MPADPKMKMARPRAAPAHTRKRGRRNEEKNEGGEELGPADRRTIFTRHRPTVMNISQKYLHVKVVCGVWDGR